MHGRGEGECMQERWPLTWFLLECILVERLSARINNGYYFLYLQLSFWNALCLSSISFTKRITIFVKKD